MMIPLPENLDARRVPGVVAVFATMGRPQLAAECVAKLLGADQVPWKIIIADNSCGRDGLENCLAGAASQLEELSVQATGATTGSATAATHEPAAPLPARESSFRDAAPRRQAGVPASQICEVLAMEDNLGNAGGIERAIDRAIEAGASWIWILDDDSFPDSQTLRALMEGVAEVESSGETGEIVYSSTVYSNTRADELAWPMHVPDANGDWKTIVRVEDMPATPVFPTRGSWLGALVPARLISRYGNVFGELFIRGEDEEFPRRLAQNGVKFRVARDSRLEHPSPPELVRYRAFGKELWIEPQIRRERIYYKVRNMIWMARRQNGAAFALLASACYPLGYMSCCGVSSLPYLARAVRDAWFNRLGKWRY